MFKVTTSNFEYEPASAGLGQSPTYLVTPRTKGGMCIELHYTKTHRTDRFKDQVSQTINVGEYAWHLTEYDKNDEAMDDMWFRNFDDADAHAFGLWDNDYDHEAIAADVETTEQVSDAPVSCAGCGASRMKSEVAAGVPCDVDDCPKGSEEA